MVETEITYDQMIWTVFSVGIISSVVILYYSSFIIPGQTNKFFALMLGFFILIYCIFLIFGYNKKKEILRRIIEENNMYYGDYWVEEEMIRRLEDECYPRAKWMGEIILGLIGFYYVYVFGTIELWSITIPIIIVLFFAFLSCVANNI